MPEKEARELMKALGEAVYGHGKPIVVKYAQEEKERLGIFHLFDSAIARLSRLWRGFWRKG